MTAVTHAGFIHRHTWENLMVDERRRAPRGGKPARGEPVIERALRLLAAFRTPEESLSLTSLAARARLSKSTALRLARHLQDWGALERGADGEFVIGLRLLEVASLAPRGHGLRATAMPYLEDLHHATGQHVLLAVRDGLDAVLVERLSAHRAGRVAYHVGGRLPLHSTGVGLVLLAFAPTEVQEQVLASSLTDITGTAPLGPVDLRRRIAAVRRDGSATNSRTLPDPMSSVAAPVYGPGQTVIAALSVIAPTDTFDPAAARPAVIAVARAVSRAMQTQHLAAPPAEADRSAAHPGRGS